MHFYLHIYTTTGHIAEPVPPIHADLVFSLKNMFLSCLYFKETQRNVYMCLLPLSQSQTIFVFPTMSHISSLQFQVN